MKTLGILVMFAVGGATPLLLASMLGQVDSWQSVIIGAASTALAFMVGLVGMIVATEYPDS